MVFITSPIQVFNDTFEAFKRTSNEIEVVLVGNGAVLG